MSWYKSDIHAVFMCLYLQWSIKLSKEGSWLYDFGCYHGAKISNHGEYELVVRKKEQMPL